MSKVAPTPPRTGWPREFVILVGAILALGVLASVLWQAWQSPDAETLSKRARDEFMAREFGLAEADLDQVLKMRAPTPFDSMLKAQLLMIKGKNVEALKALDQVPDDHPMASQARLEAGQIELRRSRFGPAEALFLKAIKLDPKLVRARLELVYIYGIQLRRPELSRAFQELSRLIPLNYSQVFTWCLTRGVSWEAVEIVETLKKCLKSDPNDRYARLGLAEGLRELSRFDEAEAALAPLPDSDPDARAARVRIALERGDDQAADTLLAAGPADNLQLALLRGRFAQARGDGPEAVRQFRIAYNQAPNLREAVLGLGQSLKTTGDLEAAKPLLEEASHHERLGALVQRAAVAANRTDPALMRDLGAACAAVHRYPEAKAWYNLAISQDPLDPQAQEGLSEAKRLEAEAQNKIR